jgi:hypothetical protein
MIKRANQFNRYDGCTYHLNTNDDLRLFSDASFDLIYSGAVLQHMEPRYSLAYIPEFVRLLTSDGVAVFEAPSSYTPLSQLPEGAHKAELKLKSTPPVIMRASASANLVVRVTNLGDVRWPFLGAPYPIRLGSRWLRNCGNMGVMIDDGRAEMPRLLQPGDSGLFNLSVTAPPKPGFYILELDMVEEGITWFGDRDSHSLRLSVQVRGEGKTVATIRQRFGKRSFRHQEVHQIQQGHATADDTCQPVMEMHCLPRNDVVRVIHAAHGEAMHVDEYDPIGDGHITCRYFVRRAVERQ